MLHVDFINLTVWAIQVTLAEVIENYSGLYKEPPQKKTQCLLSITETHKEHKWTFQLISTEPYVLCLRGWGEVGSGALNPVSDYRVCVSCCLWHFTWTTQSLPKYNLPGNLPSSCTPDSVRGSLRGFMLTFRRMHHVWSSAFLWGTENPSCVVPHLDFAQMSVYACTWLYSTCCSERPVKLKCVVNHTLCLLLKMECNHWQILDVSVTKLLYVRI